MQKFSVVKKFLSSRNDMGKAGRLMGRKPRPFVIPKARPLAGLRDLKLLLT